MKSANKTDTLLYLLKMDLSAVLPMVDITLLAFEKKNLTQVNRKVLWGGRPI